MYEKIDIRKKISFILICFNSYSVIRGSGKSNKSKVIKIGPAVLECGGTTYTLFYII